MNRPNQQVIFNGDWGAMFWAPNLWQPEGGPYSARALHSFVELLAENQVDTFAISPNTQLAWYPSKVVPTALDGYTRGDKRWARWFRSCPDETNLAMMDRYLDLLEAGVDWMAETIVACEQRQITPWASIRMNDPHGYLEKWVDNPMNCPLFKDPDNRLRGTPLRPGRHADVLWVGLNFERQVVRDYFLTMIRELVLDYDTQGLELDFLRTPAICEPNASHQTIDSITSWIAEISDLARLKAQQTGRAFPFGLRIPAAFGALRSIGLDVRAIAEAGLIDFVSPSNYMQTAWALPLDQLRQQLGPDISIFGNVEFALNGVSAYSPEAGSTQLRSPFIVTEALLGAAAGQRALGADGIELYNYYAADEDNADERICTRQNMQADYTAIRKIQDLQRLRGEPKQYAFTTMLAPVWNPPFDTPDALPDILEPDWRRAYRLPMCAEPADCGLQLTIQIVVDRRDNLPALAVSFNDCWPTTEAQATDELLFAHLDHAFHEPDLTAFNYSFHVSEILEGWNEISVYNGSHAVETAATRRQNSVTIRSIELGIR